MPDAQITVFVSKSEPAEAIPKLQNYGLNAIAAEVGTDYSFFAHTRRIGIERKTIGNLLGSLKDRQLVEQAQRGVRAFDRYILLIEGKYDYRADGKLIYHAPGHPGADHNGWVESGWQWRALDGMLMDLTLTLGIPIARCPMFESAEAVARIAMNLCAESHKFLRERQRPTLSPTAALGGELYSDAIWSLCALPGCGPEIAEALIAEYGTLATVIESLSSELTYKGWIPPADVRVNGKRLGEKRVKKITEAVLADYRSRG